MATAPGLLKVGQTSVAFLIFILISNPVSYSHHEVLEWCMAVYCICFIVSMVVVILRVGEWTGRKSVPFSQFLSAYGLLAFLMYLSAVIVWPIFTFGEKYLRGGDMSKQIGVTLLTGINMLLYLADLVYTVRQVFITSALLCLSASVIFPLFFLKEQGWWYADERSFRITSTIFSCLAAVAYICEVSLTKAKPGQVAGYMATVPGLLKVCQTVVACIIFILISNPVSYSHHAALEWCMAVYCICFIVSMVVVILCVGECTGFLPVPFSQFLSAYGLLAFLMYLSAVIVWPIFTFDKKYRRGGDMSKQIGVAVLTAINMLLYLADLVYTAHLVFITK
eukprot:XP_011617380.1 PREDICTED: myeloid-associated differentiation marker homolog [Takifugu rubripes]